MTRSHVLASSLALGALWLGCPGTATAQAVSIDLDEAAVSSLGLDSADLQDSIQGFLGDDLRLVDLEHYLSQMAEASAFSSRGMGVDYGSNPKRLVAGIGIGTAVSGLNPNVVFRRRGDEVLPAEGFAGQITAMAGLNLGMFAKDREDGRKSLLKRMRLYANYMVAQPPSSQPIRGSLRNAGVHLQAKLVGPLDLKLVELGGLDVTAGIESSTYIFNLGQALPLAEVYEGYDLRWEGRGDYTLRARSWSLPLEASTNVRVLFATVYGGVAADLVQAHATAVAELDGDVWASRNGGDEVRLGSAGIGLTSEGKALPFSTRAFLGAQLDVLMFKLYGQVNFDGQERLGAHAGLRVVL